MFRIIPRLEIKSRNLIKGMRMEGLRVIRNFDNLIDAYSKSADEIFLEDIVASLYSREIDFRFIEKISDQVQIPIAYAGGVSSKKIIEKLFNCGVDKVYLNSSLFKKIKLIKDVSKIYGSQSICALLQTKKIDNKWEVFADAGRNRTGIILNDWIKILINQGIGELAIVSIDHDGMYNGVDLNLIKLVNEMNLNIPILYGGGIKDKNDIDVLLKYNFQGALVSHILHFKKKDLTDLKVSN